MHININKSGCTVQLTKPEVKSLQGTRAILAALTPYNAASDVVEKIDKVIARIQEDGVFADPPAEPTP